MHASLMRRRPSPLVVLLCAIFALAGGVAALIVTGLELRVEAGPFVRFLALAAGMLALAGWCRLRGLDARLSHSACLVSAGTIALMICGIISNAGLGFRLPLTDPSLTALDAAIGIDVERSVRAMAVRPWLIDALAWFYNNSPLAVVALILWAIARRETNRAWELAATCFAAMQAVAIVSVLMPAVGAMAHLEMTDLQGAGLPRGAGVYHLAAFEHFRSGAGGVLRLSDMSGLVTFPSFHTVLALLAVQALWDTRLRWLAVGWTATVIVSTVPIGGHYVTDLVAGTLIWALAMLVSRRAVINSPSA